MWGQKVAIKTLLFPVCGYFSILILMVENNPELITEQDDVFTSVIFPSTDDGQMEAKDRKRDRLMSCRCVPFYHNWPKHQ